uniref:Dynein light chain n=1 Tax=Globodera pallida TaxID=36090 RepID=A0A183CA31_GLOPA
MFLQRNVMPPAGEKKKNYLVYVNKANAESVDDVMNENLDAAAKLEAHAQKACQNAARGLKNFEATVVVQTTAEALTFQLSQIVECKAIDL